MRDQAANLRILADERRFSGVHPSWDNRKKIILTSGKGGVGKSFLSLHLGRALAELSERVLIVDTNLHNPGLHVLTNSDPSYPLTYWMENETEVDPDAMIRLGDGLDLLANSAKENRRYFHENAELLEKILAPMSKSYDYVLLDTHTGFGQWNLSLMQISDMCLMLSITDPTSVIDTYTMIKAVLPYLASPAIQLVVNQVFGRKNGLEAHQNLNMALKHFLDFEVDLLSMIPFDMEVKLAGQEQKPLWTFSKNSAAMKEIQKMAKSIQNFDLKNVGNNNPIYQEVNI